MWNPFKKSRNRVQDGFSKHYLDKVARVFGGLDQLEQKNILVWKPKERQLFIASQLASVMMVSAEKWQGFMDNVFMWLYHREAQEAWEKYFMNEELKAVREAKESEKLKVKSEKSKSPRVLTKADIMAIRQARREEIMLSDIEQPKVKPFQFFISHPTKDADGTWQIEMLAVGTYDEGNLELVPWEEIEVSG